MEECRQLLWETVKNEQLRGKPLLLLANKQDRPGALKPDQIIEKLQLSQLITELNEMVHLLPTRVVSIHTHPLTLSPTHSLIHSPTHSLNHSLTHSPTNSPTHSLTHSLIHLPTHSPMHPLSHTLIQTMHTLYFKINKQCTKLLLKYSSADQFCRSNGCSDELFSVLNKHTNH